MQIVVEEEAARRIVGRNATHKESWVVERVVERVGVHDVVVVVQSVVRKSKREESFPPDHLPRFLRLSKKKKVKQDKTHPLRADPVFDECIRALSLPEHKLCTGDLNTHNLCGSKQCRD
jgi:hypothetical protein